MYFIASSARLSATSKLIAPRTSAFRPSIGWRGSGLYSFTSRLHRDFNSSACLDAFFMDDRRFSVAGCQCLLLVVSSRMAVVRSGLGGGLFRIIGRRRLGGAAGVALLHRAA